MEAFGISVVVCSHNGKGRLEPTLKALFAQQVEQSIHFEILVIDNASTDGTQEFCENLHSQFGKDIAFRVVCEPQPGLNFARKCGLVNAAYDWILFCDDDNHLFPDYLQTAAGILNTDNKIGVLGAYGLPLFDVDPPAWFSTYAHSFAVGAQHSISGKINSNAAEVYGAGAFVRKKPLLDFFALGFDTITTDRKGNNLASGGDVEWCYIVQLAGYEIWYDDRLRFYHAMPASRLNWAYYLRLKQGIASGAALLFPYQLVLQGHIVPGRLFALGYLVQAAKRQLVFLNRQLRSMGKKLSAKDELALAVLKSKALSFRQSYAASKRHYEVLCLFRSRYV
jgi:glycosyltransferase involved in cell wall biosynthesis